MEIFWDLSQQSEEWFKSRISSATGSKMKAIMGTDGARKTLIYDLLEAEFAPVEEKYKSPMMKRGNDKEAAGIKRYEEEFGVDVKVPGYIKVNDYTGISPDGVIVGEDGIIRKAQELKSLGGKAHIKHILEGTWPTEYKWQVVHYFLCIDTLEELDFILWNPDMVIKDKQLYVVTLKREDFIMDIIKAKQKIEEFRDLHLSYVKKLF